MYFTILIILTSRQTTAKKIKQKLTSQFRLGSIVMDLTFIEIFIGSGICTYLGQNILLIIVLLGE